MSNALVLRLATTYRDLMNSLFYSWSGRDRRPVFHDIDETFPFLRVIEEHYDEIREELLAILPDQDRMRRYHELDEAQEYISASDEKAWRVFYLRIKDDPFELQAKTLCPRTVECLSGIPNLLGAFFSILEPGKSIPAHNGVFFGYLRYHLAFLVPREHPPSIRIKDQVYTWKERESVLFDDSWNHEVMNEATESRVVMIVDLLRPMPWPLDWMNRTWPAIKRWIGADPAPEQFDLKPRRAQVRPSRLPSSPTADVDGTFP